MSTSRLPKSVALTPELHSYLLDVGTPSDALLHELASRTRRLVPDQAHMMIAPEEGALLTFLARLVSAGTAVEVGTFTGYSSICLARGLTADGRLITCDLSVEWTAVAREFWERAGVADRVDLRLGPAQETLRHLPQQEFLDLASLTETSPDTSTTGRQLCPGYDRAACSSSTTLCSTGRYSIPLRGRSQPPSGPSTFMRLLTGESSW